MNRKEKEFEVQKALGLADEYDLTIRTRVEQAQLSMKKIKDAVEKHTFTFKCTEEKFYSSLPPRSYGVELRFEVKCVHEIIELIIAEFRLHALEITLTFREMRKVIKGKFPYYKDNK